MNSSMPPTTQPNWNNKGIQLSYGNAATMATMNEFNVDIVAEFMNSRNDAGPSTQLTNDENYRRSSKIRQARAYGTHQHFH